MSSYQLFPFTLEPFISLIEKSHRVVTNGHFVDMQCSEFDLNSFAFGTRSDVAYVIGVLSGSRKLSHSGLRWARSEVRNQTYRPSRYNPVLLVLTYSKVHMKEES